MPGKGWSHQSVLVCLPDCTQEGWVGEEPRAGWAAECIQLRQPKKRTLMSGSSTETPVPDVSSSWMLTAVFGEQSASLPPQLQGIFLEKAQAGGQGQQGAGLQLLRPPWSCSQQTGV